MIHFSVSIFFFFNATATTEIYTLSLHDALPISQPLPGKGWTRTRAMPRPRRSSRETEAAVNTAVFFRTRRRRASSRSEEHTSELQSRLHLVCRLLLEKKKKKKTKTNRQHTQLKI